MNDRPPLIGISSYPRAGARESFSLPTGYVDAIRAAGGLPVLLPPGERQPQRLLDHIDGLILSGGGDIAPDRYAGSLHHTLYGISPERDAFELELAAAALERHDLPLLCICRGMQILNILLGGTLHAHIPDLGDGMLVHRLPEVQPTTHPANLKPDSRLADILATTEIEVCSWHHQAIHHLGRDLRPVGWAADGVIEAVEHERHPFCIGVQWHPEMQLDDPVQQTLFRIFVQRCAARNREAVPENGAREESPRPDG